MTNELHVRLLSQDARPPVRAHKGDAGLDLFAAESATLAPGERLLVGTGIAVAIPEGWVGLACPRSGNAMRHGIGMVNAPGVIDAGYRGELRLLLHNTDMNETFVVELGDRIGQLLIMPIALPTVVEVEELSDSTRNENGFGSTGVRELTVSGEATT